MGEDSVQDYTVCDPFVNNIQNHCELLQKRSSTTKRGNIGSQITGII